MSDINHEAVKVWALEITADEYGNPLSAVAMAQAYLDLAALLEAAHANADELQSRLDTVTTSHCEMLRELQAERQRVDRLAELVEHCRKEFRTVEARLVSSDRVDQYMASKLTTIMEGRDNG